jgi:hypothetical protein
MVAVVIGCLFLSGAMLGQRCAKAYPGDGLMQERCVYNLTHDLPP